MLFDLGATSCNCHHALFRIVLFKQYLFSISNESLCLLCLLHGNDSVFCLSNLIFLAVTDWMLTTSIKFIVFLLKLRLVV